MKNKKPQRGNLLAFVSEKPAGEKTVREYRFNPDEVRRRARQNDHIQRWMELRSLKRSGYDDVE